MLEPENLRAFVVLAEELNFIRAADRLGLAQSVVSKRLMRLEDRLGARLIARNRRSKVELTREGGQFLPLARATLEQLEMTELRGRRIARGEAGALRVGYVFSAIMTGSLPALIRHLRSVVPALEIVPFPMETPEQLAAIANERLDVAIVRPRPSYPSGVLSRCVHREGVQLGLAADNKLVTRARIVCADLSGAEFIVPQFHEEVGLIDVVTQIGRTGGFDTPRMIYTKDFITAAGLAAAGMGVAAVPKSLGSLRLGGLVYRPLVDLEASLELVMLYRRDLPALIADLLRTFDTDA